MAKLVGLVGSIVTKLEHSSFQPGKVFRLPELTSQTYQIPVLLGKLPNVQNSIIRFSMGSL